MKSKWFYITDYLLSLPQNENPRTWILCVTLLFSSSDTKSWNTKLQPKFSASVLYFWDLTNSLWWKKEGKESNIRCLLIVLLFYYQIPKSKIYFPCCFYLKSAFVTGYLSILKGFSLTSLMGDSPSFPSAALVPINIFPPGMFTISSAAGRQEGTCSTNLNSH